SHGAGLTRREGVLVREKRGWFVEVFWIVRTLEFFGHELKDTATEPVAAGWNSRYRGRDLSAHQFDEKWRELRIKLPAGVRFDFTESPFRGHPLAVGSVAGHGVVSVCDRQDPGNVWDGLARQTIWIAFAVPSLMVMPDSG